MGLYSEQMKRSSFQKNNQCAVLVNDAIPASIRDTPYGLDFADPWARKCLRQGVRAAKATELSYTDGSPSCFVNLDGPKAGVEELAKVKLGPKKTWPGLTDIRGVSMMIASVCTQPVARDLAFYDTKRVC
jgi:hypothetical protein